MAFARFNPCSPCCNCSFSVSYTNGGVDIPGITITVRDIKGSGVGSCVTTESGCSIPIKHPGTYYVHNDWCNTTQQVVIAKCGNDVEITIPSVAVPVIANSECFFKVPNIRFTFDGPGTHYVTEASGNILVGPLPFPQRASLATLSGPRPSGQYTVTIEDVEDDHWPNSVQKDIYCSSSSSPFPTIPLWTRKGFVRAPHYITAGGCPAPGITVSDSDGHSATTDADGRICDVWEYDMADGGGGPDQTRVHVTKTGFIDPCREEGCVRTRGRCFGKMDCDDHPNPPGSDFPEYNLLWEDGYWGSPTDDCIESQPESLTVTFNGFKVQASMCQNQFDEEGNFTGTIPIGAPFYLSSVEVTRDSPYVGFPYTYAWPPTGGVLPGGGYDPNPFICGGSVGVAVAPGCRKDINSSFPYGYVYVNTTDGYVFPNPPWTTLITTGTSACPTMFTATEYGYAWNGESWGPTTPSGRSATVSA